jgi:hypothetical protein
MLKDFITIISHTNIEEPTLVIKVVKTGKLHCLTNNQAVRAANIMYVEAKKELNATP